MHAIITHIKKGFVLLALALMLLLVNKLSFASMGNNLGADKKITPISLKDTSNERFRKVYQ